MTKPMSTFRSCMYGFNSTEYTIQNVKTKGFYLLLNSTAPRIHWLSPQGVYLCA